jgi:hypothetical protein
MINPDDLKKWIEARKKRLENEDPKGRKKINLPNGIQIHIHMPQMPAQQKLPLSRDGKTLMTQDNVAQYPS